MTPEETKRWIWSRCTECGDCLLWDGAVDDSGTPTLRLPGSRKVEAARRVLLTAMGKEIKGRLATTRCDNKLCLAERHVVAWTRKQLQRRSGKKLRGNVARNARLAMAARRKGNAKLTMERVREMRAAGLTTRQAERMYGVAQSTAANALSGRSWKDYSSPFVGLFAGLAGNDSNGRRASA